MEKSNHKTPKPTPQPVDIYIVEDFVTIITRQIALEHFKHTVSGISSHRLKIRNPQHAKGYYIKSSQI